MEKIKLVIWDLDETFWEGTLSEEGIKVIERNVQLVRTLTERGIMNSIVSKNNFEDAKNKLVELGIWEFFIFPKIDWLPKGQLVKQIIQEAQLRAVNVLFLDDNYLNIEEVSFYNEGIHGKLPKFINEIDTHQAFLGKNDLSLSRLVQYKVLETKAIAQKSYSDNTEFLYASGIRVTVEEATLEYLDRVAELIERTNQLNFTKIRIPRDEVKTLLVNKNYKSSVVRVTDNFGEYGVVGFVCQSIDDSSLLHFVFSCRTINLGVEQYVYALLKFPEINILGDVATELKIDVTPTWINQKGLKNIDNKKARLGANSLTILLKGGCDLEQMLHYFQFSNVHLLVEFNSVNESNIALHKEHSVFVKKAIENEEREEQFDCYSKLPFLHQSFNETNVNNDDVDIIIYSVLMDYTQKIYKHKNKKETFAYGTYNTSLLSEDKEYNTPEYLKQRDVDYLRQNFYGEEQISIAEFKENLSFILKAVNKPIIFINGAEVSSDEPKAMARHREMNQALDEVVKEHNNAYLLDVRKLVGSEDITDNIRHYKRDVYRAMAMSAAEIVEGLSETSLNLDKKNYFKGKLKHMIRGVRTKLKRYI